MSGDIWSAYAATRVTIEFPEGAVTVTPTDEGEGALDGTWHVITAHNPGSIRLPDDENRRRNDRLVEVLTDAGYQVVPASGQGLDGAWPAEASVAVHGIDSSAAAAFGREFGQLAVFRVDPTQISVIDCRDASARSTHPMSVRPSA